MLYTRCGTYLFDPCCLYTCCFNNLCFETNCYRFICFRVCILHRPYYSCRFLHNYVLSANDAECWFFVVYDSFVCFRLVSDFCVRNEELATSESSSVVVNELLYDRLTEKGTPPCCLPCALLVDCILYLARTYLNVYLSLLVIDWFWLWLTRTLFSIIASNFYFKTLNEFFCMQNFYQKNRYSVV